MVTLNDLSVGDSAIIVAVHGDDGIAVRLMEMGLIDGEPIELIGLAPLGDPMEFAVRGYRLSLRRDEAQRVEVQRG
jgi:ferrous iron transport protein A